MSVQDNIAKLEAAKQMVIGHCMCADLQDDGYRFTIIFPEGDFQVGGIRVERSANGLEQALTRMEKFWLESFPAYIV